MDDEPKTTPIMSDTPEDEAELAARRREVREEADQDVALRGAATVGALGGNVGPVAGAITGRGGALGVEETQAEDRQLDDDGRPASEDADRRR